MRILFVNTRPPWPGRRGDQVRTAGFVRHLATRHEVRVLAQCGPDDRTANPPHGVVVETVAVGRMKTAVRLALGTARGVLGAARPFQNGFYDHPALRAALRRQLVEFRPDVVVLVLGRLGHLLDDVEKVAPQVPVVVDLVDALSLNFAQRARRDGLLAWLWRWESRRLARWDASLAARAAALTVVSERDRTALIEGAPQALRGVVKTSTHVVPFGLDLPHEAEAPAKEPLRKVEETEPIVALTGNLGYFPTVDGARHFARHVWPKVRRRVPGARWLLAGARPPQSVRRLVALPGVELVANPGDLRAEAMRARVSVAPMRSGSGTPIKVLEAMTWWLPVVATPEAAAGLDGLPEDALAIAGSDDEFAERVSEFLTDPERALRSTSAAWNWLRERHDLAASAARFEQILRSALTWRCASIGRSAD